MIPKKGVLFTTQLETTIFTPEGEGPFPVVVINHGKALGNPSFQDRYRPLPAVRYFMQRGYLVAVPMRQGFSKSTGMYVGAGCNVESNGRVQAEDVQAVLDYLVAQPRVDKDRLFVIGQSHGGWTTLAFGTLNHPGVRGLVNFAGGLRQEQCAGWEGTLARAAGSYGAETKLPSLWFYGDNDSYFSSYTFRQMHERYTASQGRATLVAFGNFGTDAHTMFSARAGQKIWQPEMSRFLQQVGLPHEIVLPQYGGPAPMAAPPRTDYAPLEKVEAVPYVKEKGRAGYAAFLTKDFSRAFAIAPNGAWGWASGGNDPLKRALDNCNKSGKGACSHYAVDDAVVWKE
ncbi:MAG: dienelactone hydrolase family protein [Burkholderiales bacterium]